ncbi:MAG: PIN domain-containing protein [Pseudolysinimonas sp.]|uniref:PIN domain-containing protein n=1 Tax=Pseudolysinimonas sp. TaxID=2680009 RepID=UPI0032662048
MAELAYGVEKSAAPVKNAVAVEEFLGLVDVLAFGRDAAENVGEIRPHLAHLGTPIGPFDGLIAGHARSIGLTVMTRNRREFDRVPGLRVVDWAERGHRKSWVNARQAGTVPRPEA